MTFFRIVTQENITDTIFFSISPTRRLLLQPIIHLSHMADRELLQQQYPVRRPRDEAQNGTSATVAAGEVIETGTAADNGTSNLSAVIPGWFSEINCMWPGARARQLQTKRLWTYALSFSCVAGFIVIVLNNFQDQMVFYVTPTDAMEQYKENPKKTKFRLGGLVLEGSVAPEKDKVPPPLLKPAKSGGWKQKKKKQSKGKHLRQASIRSSQVQAHHSIDPLLFTTRRTSFSGRVRVS
ncbi:Cytochrome c-type biogenesis protein CcmE homolog, mitochondrial [Linum perenne]